MLVTVSLVTVLEGNRHHGKRHWVAECVWPGDSMPR